MNRLFWIAPLTLILCGCREESFIQKASSMEPTIMAGEVVSVDMNAYSNATPQRWDIVVFRPPFHASSAAAKEEDMGIWMFRVVGLPGESISFDDSGIQIDGHHIEQPHGKNIEYTKMTGSGIPDRLRSPRYPFVIPDGHFFVLGDNPMQSNDSRLWGPVSIDRILGKVNKK